MVGSKDTTAPFLQRFELTLPNIQYTDALTYACDFKPHKFTSVAPFELLLSRTPGLISLKHTLCLDEQEGECK